MEKQFNRKMICPWCGHGETMADGRAKVTISVQCAKCKRVYWGDLDTLRTERGTAQKRIGRR